MSTTDFSSGERRSQINRFYAVPLEWIPVFAVTGVTLIALTVLLGWFLELPLLYSFLTGMPPLAADAALGLFFGAISLFLLYPEEIGHTRKRVGQIFALLYLLPVALSALNYLQIVSTDTLNRFLPPQLSLEPDALMRPAFYLTALAISGLALFLLGVRHKGLLTTIQWLAVFTLTLAVVTLFGYIYNLTGFYGYPNVNGMGLPTSIALTLLMNGILFASPRGGIMRSITSDAAGSKIIRRLLPIVVVAPLMIGWLMLVGQRTGLITPDFGLAMHEVLTTLLITVFIIYIALSLNREDKRRQNAEEGAKKYQSDLAHMVCLNTMGEMVASLAHELKQPLTAISLYAANSKQMLSATGAEITALHNQLDEIMAQSERAADIIRRTREFARKKEPRTSSVQLNELITDVKKFFEVTARDVKVQLLLDLDPRIGNVKGDANQLRQVLLNIIHNAIESLQASGDKPKQVIIQTSMTDAGEVRTDITDNGPGMDADTLSHIFESFFTTKDNTGMGMGLSISRSIVEAHGGQLWARSTPGQGATFTFTLPRER